MPAYCTGLGKAMLAFSDGKQVAETIAHGLVPRTEYTIVVPEIFCEELHKVGACGIAFDREESIRGIGCIAAPLRGSGRAIGAISLTGTAAQAGNDQVTAALRDATSLIWGDLFS